MMIQRILIVVVVVWLAGSSGLMAMGRMELGTSEPAPLNEWNAFKAFLAQAPDGERLRGGVTEQGEELKRRHRHIEQLRILKMLELLDLAEDQEFEFLTAFRQTRREQRRLEKEKGDLLGRLASGFKSRDIDDVQINGVVDRVLSIDEEKRQVNADFLKIARRVLTAEQFGKFVIFQDRFEAELLEHVRMFRERKHRRKLPDLLLGDG